MKKGALNTGAVAQGWAFTTSLGNVFQCLTILKLKNFPEYLT